jgi:hypothetical protein
MTTNGGPFDWMEPRRNPEAVRQQKGRREAMYRTELEDRAALLARLGRGRAEARARLQANIAWDFERGGSPITAAQIDAIVERAFERVFGSAPPARPSARAKGGAR